MKNILGLAFILLGVSMLIYFSFGSITTLMDSANSSINASEDPALSHSFNTSTNITVGVFAILGNIPLLLVVIMVIVVLFMFVGAVVTR